MTARARVHRCPLCNCLAVSFHVVMCVPSFACCAGLSALDAAKMSIEHFIKGLYSARLESAAGAHRFALVASDAVRLASHIQTLLEEKHSAEGLRKDLDLMEKNLHAQRKGSNKAPEVLLDGEELNFHLSDGVECLFGEGWSVHSCKKEHLGRLWTHMSTKCAESFCCCSQPSMPHPYWSIVI